MMLIKFWIIIEVWCIIKVMQALMVLLLSQYSGQRREGGSHLSRTEDISCLQKYQLQYPYLVVQV